MGERLNDIEEDLESRRDGRRGEGGGVCNSGERTDADSEVASSTYVDSVLTTSIGDSENSSDSSAPSTSPMKYPCTMLDVTRRQVSEQLSEAVQQLIWPNRANNRPTQNEVKDVGKL